MKRRKGSKYDWIDAVLDGIDEHHRADAEPLLAAYAHQKRSIVLQAHEDRSVLLKLARVLVHRLRGIDRLYDRLERTHGELKASIETIEREHASLLQFATNVLDDFPHDIPDMYEIEQIATAAGLLIATRAEQACGPSCFCAEHAEFPLTCFRKAPLLKEDA